MEGAIAEAFCLCHMFQVFVAVLGRGRRNHFSALGNHLDERVARVGCPSLWRVLVTVCVILISNGDVSSLIRGQLTVLLV